MKIQLKLIDRTQPQHNTTHQRQRHNTTQHNTTTTTPYFLYLYISFVGTWHNIIGRWCCPLVWKQLVVCVRTVWCIMLKLFFFFSESFIESTITTTQPHNNNTTTNNNNNNNNTTTTCHMTELSLLAANSWMLLGIRRMYSLLERIFDRSAHLPTISMARHMMSDDVTVRY